MSAIADLMRALMPFADDVESSGQCAATARDALRKHAPCEGCGGLAQVQYAHGPEQCQICDGAGWTPASVETAIARAEEQERAKDRLLAAWEELYRARDGYHRHSFSEEWKRYEQAHLALVAAGGPDFRAERDAEE